MDAVAGQHDAALARRPFEDCALYGDVAFEGDAAYAFSESGSGTLTMADVFRDERPGRFDGEDGDTGLLGCFCDAVAAAVGRHAVVGAVDGAAADARR